MVAGATGIDLFLLVIDAGEGARPQTHEHLAILRLLGVEAGVVAVTKVDAVDDETLELAVDEARELVPGAEVVAVSAKTGAGLDDLRAALGRVADRRRRRDRRTARAPVRRPRRSRCAGSARSSRARSGRDDRRGRRAPVEPGGREVRVRSVQVHDAPVARADGRAARRAQPAGRRATRRARAATRSSRRARIPSRTASTSRSSELRRRAGRRSRLGPPRDAPDPGAGRPRRRAVRAAAARRSRSSRRAATGSCCAARRRCGRRVVLDPAPPRHRDLRAPRAARARRRSRRRSTRRCTSSALRHVLDGELEGIAASPGRGRSRQAWLEELESESARAGSSGADPLDPGVAGAAGAVGAEASCRCCRSSGAARSSYLPGAAATLGARARRRPTRSMRELDAAGVAATKVDDAELARFLERRGTARAAR